MEHLCKLITNKHSISRVYTFVDCPYKYKLKCIDEVVTDNELYPDNALLVGKTLHLALEKSYEDAEKYYLSQFNIASDYQYNELIKIEYWSKKLHKVIDGLNIYAKEYVIEEYGFKGIVDLMTINRDGSVDLFDYKYTNSVLDYLDSPQLHVYKYYLEKRGFRVKRMGYIIIPKCKSKTRELESIEMYRLRLREELKSLDIRILNVDYDPKKVEKYFKNTLDMQSCVSYNRQEGSKCYFCQYKNICKGDCIDMKLPSCERRDIKKVTKRKIWIYGGAFSGKTTMLDKAPNPLNLNTDGNIQFVTMPYIPIKDTVIMKGRISERTLAWQIFKDSIEELEKKQNDYKTIIVDLIEDTYECCRLYKYEELGITHESDDSFKAWDKIRTEFLSTMRRFFNLDYENLIIISHEDKTKDLTKRSGDKVSLIKPNIQDKVANKLAGMVDIVARVVVDGDRRTLEFKSDEHVFGGGRLKGVNKTSVPLNWESLMSVYEEINANIKEETTETKTRSRSRL